MAAKADSKATSYTIQLAKRLVGGLSSEKIRWSVPRAGEQLAGECAADHGVSVLRGLLSKMWMPYLSKLKTPIPITEKLDVLTMLIDDADIAGWNNEAWESVLRMRRFWLIVTGGR